MDQQKKTQELSAGTLAKLLDLSLARIGQLSQEGVIDKLPNGKYAPSAITQYVTFLRSSKRNQGDVGIEIEREKLRKMKRENDEAESLVAPVAVLTDALQKAGSMIVAILDTLPLIIKRHWPEVSGDQITMVKRSVAECRNIIADMKLDFDE